MSADNTHTGAIPQVVARISLTTLHNLTGEYVEMALRGKVIVTKDGQADVTMVDSAYLDRLEQAAHGTVLAALDITAQRGTLMPDDLRTAILAGQPTPSEITDDRWND